MKTYIMKITNPMKSHYIKSPPSKEVMNMSCLRQSTTKHLTRLQEYIIQLTLCIHIITHKLQYIFVENGHVVLI